MPNKPTPFLDIAARLKDYQKKAGFKSDTEFAHALGMTYENLYQYISGKNRPGNTMQDRLRNLGCDVEWLMTGIRTAPSLMMGFAPFLGRIVATPEGKEYFDTDDIPSNAGIPFIKGDFFCLEVENDSLINAEPYNIYPGDICVFERNRQPHNGDVVAIHFADNTRTVKIIKHISREEVELKSANKFRNYPSVKVKKGDIASFGIFVMKVDMDERMKRRFGVKN